MVCAGFTTRILRSTYKAFIAFRSRNYSVPYVELEAFESPPLRVIECFNHPNERTSPVRNKLTWNGYLVIPNAIQILSILKESMNSI